MDKNCVFCRIIAGEIPAERVYEDGDMIVIKDINPMAKVHLLLIPKEHYADIIEMMTDQGAVLGRCVKKLSEMAEGLGLGGGFRLVSNKGDDGRQSVQHLHIHVLGGGKLSEKMG